DVERRVHVGDVDLRLLADLDARVELCGPFRGQHAARAAVEDPEPQRGVARRLPRTGEAVVVLLVTLGQLRAALAQYRAELVVVARSGDTKLELGLDGAISPDAQPSCHASRVTAKRRTFECCAATPPRRCTRLPRSPCLPLRRCVAPLGSECRAGATAPSRRRPPPGARSRARPARA